MTDSVSFEKLRQILASQFQVPAESLTLQSRLKEDLNLDSIDLFDLLVFWEKETNVSLNPDRFRGVRTVEELLKCFSQD